MKRVAVLFGLLTISTGAFAQLPTIGSVVNAATYSFTPLPNSPIARGAIFTVFGNNMGPLNIQHAPSLPLQTSLGGTSIRIASGSTNLQAPMLDASSTQLAAILPSNTPTGQVSVTVTTNAGTSNSFTIQVVQSNFGAFTSNQAGSGAAVIQDAKGKLLDALNPATPDQTVVMYGTGLGPLGPTSDDAIPPPQGDMTSVPVEVYVGTTKAIVEYRGRTGGFVALDQINFQIPRDNLGCAVPILVKIDKMVSNVSTIAVSNGGPCSDQYGINFGQLTSKDSLKIGGIFLSHTTTITNFSSPLPSKITADSGLGYFVQVSRDSLIKSQASFNPVSVGGCVVSFFTGNAPGPSLFTSATPLDAGNQLTVTGINGTRSISKSSQIAGLYSDALDPGGPFLANGTYTVKVPGGAGVASFSTDLQSAPLTWVIPNTPAINRNQDLTVTWTGGQSTMVLITGSSKVAVGNDSAGGFFTCLTPGNAGKFTIPSAVLLLLPQSVQAGAPGFSASSGVLAVAGYNVNPISPVPSGLDQAFSGYTDSTGVFVSYQ